MSESETRQRLQAAQRVIANATVTIRRAEAIRDTCIRQLSDNDGLSDKRPVGVR